MSKNHRCCKSPVLLLFFGDPIGVKGTFTGFVGSQISVCAEVIALLACLICVATLLVFVSSLLALRY